MTVPRLSALTRPGGVVIPLDVEPSGIPDVYRVRTRTGEPAELRAGDTLLIDGYRLRVEPQRPVHAVTYVASGLRNAGYCTCGEWEYSDALAEIVTAAGNRHLRDTRGDGA